jgi:pterin-4a-carbinolamine dehydratase
MSLRATLLSRGGHVSDRPLAFVSYRRDDSREWAALIADSLERHFGRDAVFVDTEAIRVGDDWPARIENALAAATIFIPIIGPQWLAVHDEMWRRRIDLADDWVRREIETAIQSGKPIVSVLVSGASMPGGQALPSSLVQLPNKQAVRLEDKTDIRELVQLLTERYQFRPIAVKLDYPTPVDRQPELPPDELNAAFKRIPEWSRVERDDADGKEGITVELQRLYKFKTFSDAIHFMATTARFIRITGHHPFWENQYKDVLVRLTTWDVGHRITWKDVRLASYLDRQYRQYVAFDRGSSAQDYTG